MKKMAEAFEHYYLQINSGGSWETSEASNQLEGLVASLKGNEKRSTGRKARIIGAFFEEKTRKWKYEQLFFQDAEFIESEAIFAPVVAQPDEDPTTAVLNNSKENYQPDTEIDTTGKNIKTIDLRFAYIILLVGGLVTAIGFGIRSSFGIFLTPISLELGFGREVFALAIAIQNLVMGFAQPFVGAFADRFGAFKTITIGTFFYSGGMFFMAQSTTPEMFYLSTGVVVGIGLAGAGQSLIMPAVAKRFPASKRSWVLGVVGATGSVGTFVALPVGQYCIAAVGWNNTSILIGFLLLLIIPLAMVFRFPQPADAIEEERKLSMRQALKEAFEHPSFWLLCSGFFVCGFHVVYIGVHLPSYVVDIGLSMETGAWALGIVGLMNILGGYTAGVLGGKFSKKYLLSGLYFGRSLVMAGFILLPPSEFVVYGFAVLMGLFWLSTVPLTTGLVADLYGTRYMTTLYGIVFLSHQLGAFCGGWLGGYVFDATGSYNLVWWISVALGLISMIAHWPIKALPYRQLSPAV